MGLVLGLNETVVLQTEAGGPRSTVTSGTYNLNQAGMLSVQYLVTTTGATGTSAGISFVIERSNDRLHWLTYNAPTVVSGSTGVVDVVDPCFPYFRLTSTVISGGGNVTAMISRKDYNQ